jgi:hypothetical protein
MGSRKLTTELVRVEVKTQGSQPFGLVLGGSIQLRGPLCRAQLSLSSTTDRNGEELQEYHLIYLEDSATYVKEQNSFHIYLDDNSADALERLFHTQIYLLFCSVERFPDVVESEVADGVSSEILSNAFP